MSRIELELSEYQGMRNKIKNLESALNSVSKEAALNKEKIEKAKALFEDLKSESFFTRLFKWKSTTILLRELFEDKNNNEYHKNINQT